MVRVLPVKMGRGLFSTTRDRVRVRVRVRAATEIVAFSRFGCDNPGVRAAFFLLGLGFYWALPVRNG